MLYPDPQMALPPDGVDLDAWFEQHPPEFKTERVTRDELVRRMAGSSFLDQFHAAGCDARVIALAQEDAVIQRWNTAS